jgi:hypothetical protein
VPSRAFTPRQCEQSKSLPPSGEGGRRPDEGLPTSKMFKSSSSTLAARPSSALRAPSPYGRRKILKISLDLFSYHTYICQTSLVFRSRTRPAKKSPPPSGEPASEEIADVRPCKRPSARPPDAPRESPMQNHVRTLMEKQPLLPAAEQARGRCRAPARRRGGAGSKARRQHPHRHPPSQSSVDRHLPRAYKAAGRSFERVSGSPLHPPPIGIQQRLRKSVRLVRSHEHQITRRLQGQ